MGKGYCSNGASRNRIVTLRLLVKQFATFEAPVTVPTCLGGDAITIPRRWPHSGAKRLPISDLRCIRAASAALRRTPGTGLSAAVGRPRKPQCWSSMSVGRRTNSTSGASARFATHPRIDLAHVAASRPEWRLEPASTRMPELPARLASTAPAQRPRRGLGERPVRRRRPRRLRECCHPADAATQPPQPAAHRLCSATGHSTSEQRCSLPQLFTRRSPTSGHNTMINNTPTEIN